MPLRLMKDGRWVASLDPRTLRWFADDAETAALLNDASESVRDDYSPAHGCPARHLLNAMARELRCTAVDTEPNRSVPGRIYGTPPETT